MSILRSLSPVQARLASLPLAALIVFTIMSCAPTQEVDRHHHGEPHAAQVAPGSPNPDTDLTNQGSVYVGERACMQCHEHAATHASTGVHVKAFRSNPRTARQSEVCEACHGPGSKHVDDTMNSALIIGYTKAWGTPVAKQNAQCLTCHQGGERLNWVQSAHDTHGVACSDCHNPMIKVSASGALQRPSISETCYSCHPQQRSEFLKRSHMPVPEGKMSCQDCHNPHGSTTKPLLKADTVNDVCYQCHAEKRGPFIWEHAPVRENCSNCHLPHGSNQDNLLSAPRPFLCQQCHDAAVGHPGTFYNNSQTAASALLGGTQSQRVIGRSCQNCHTQVHGSNHPSGARFQR